MTAIKHPLDESLWKSRYYRKISHQNKGTNINLRFPAALSSVPRFARYNLLFAIARSLCSLQDKGCQIVQGKKNPPNIKNRTKPLFFPDFSTPFEPKPRAVCRDPGSGLVDFLLGFCPKSESVQGFGGPPTWSAGQGQTIKTSLWPTLTRASSHVWTQLTYVCGNTEGFSKSGTLKFGNEAAGVRTGRSHEINTFPFCSPSPDNADQTRTLCFATINFPYT